jgi:chemotaxis protein methyltransferase CheR
METVQRAAARIETLAGASAATRETALGLPTRPGAFAASPGETAPARCASAFSAPELGSPAVPPLESAPELRAVLDGLAAERFVEGIEILERLPAARAREPDAALLRAVLLVHTGRLSEAEALCQCLLARDALCANACYVLALCREAAGDASGAVEHDRVAASLDPAFAMPRLHLGLMARRAGDRSGARRELEKAADLLVREDPSRVLLFGGGFGKDGLIALCRAETIGANAKRRRS